MKKQLLQNMTILPILVFVVGVFFVSNTRFHQLVREGILVSPAYAEEDDEDEYEREGGDDNYSTTTAEKTKKVKSVPTYQTVLVNKVITTLDPIFTTDQDGDGIVDGLDPHPTVHEQEYFTDDDNDGIANAFDAHNGEDDFAYYEQENDANGNGLLDSYETLGSL